MKYGDYIHRLIERATINPLFENNRKGSYRIESHGEVNCFVMHLYKNKNHIATVKVNSNRTIYGDISRAGKTDQKRIERSLLDLYRGFPMILKNFQA